MTDARGAGGRGRREADLATLAGETWDVVIVGGGIVGAGALLDAASRGMRAALIEQDDIASGTSSRSSRLIHGGLRYLEQFRFGLVRQALAERSELLRLAPHLVRIEPLLFPIYGTPFLSKAFYDAGLTLYDILGARHDGGWHRRLSKAQTLELAPTLRQEGLRGGLVYHDGVEDDARYTLAVARTATAAGAVAVTRVRATGLRSDPRSGVIEALTGHRPADRHGPGRSGRGRSWTRRASGPPRRIIRWAAAPPGSCRVAAPTWSCRVSGSRTGPGSRSASRARSCSSCRGRTHWLIGTTDAPFEGPADRPAAAEWEIQHLLDTVNATMDVDLTRADVVGTYAGLAAAHRAVRRVHGQGIP